MSSVILVSESTDLARRTRIASEDRIAIIRPQQMPVGPAQLLALAPMPESVSVVMIDVRSEENFVQQALALATRFERQHPNVGVLLVTDNTEALGLAALRAGVRDLLEPDLDIPDIRWALKRAGEAATRSAPPEVDGQPEAYSTRVITVASPKGGVGKTTVATNIARALADHSPTGTVLVDLDVQFGDVAAALDLDPDYTVSELIEGPALKDPIALKTLLARHPLGLQVACGVKSPVEADKITPGGITSLLTALRPEFRYVVLDTAPGLTEHTLAALDHTTDLVLVTSLDVPGVRGLRKELEVLDQLNLPPHTRHIIVNNVDKLAGLSLGDVEDAIGRKVDLAVPRTGIALRSTNIGSPMVESMPRDRVSREIRAFTGRFAPAGGQGERSRWRRGAS